MVTEVMVRVMGGGLRGDAVGDPAGKEDGG